MTITISSGVTSGGLTISSGDPLVVLSGGTVEAIKILSGGSATVSSGAHGYGFTVSSGGLVVDFGYVQSAVLSAGADMAMVEQPVERLGPLRICAQVLPPSVVL